ncbi:MAG: hypothetical protein AVDCRST_MAG30-1333, partial [uncultured Solirubrobacteraceae bacterium]
MTALRIALLALLALFALPAAAGAALAPSEQLLEMAREEAGFPKRPDSRHALPAGRLEVDPAETVSSQPGQRLIFTVTLDRRVESGRLELRLPDVWVGRAPSGLRWATAPRLVPGAAKGATLERSGRTVALTFRDAAAGDSASFELRDVGIPARTYRLPFSWTGAENASGAAVVRFYAPSREGSETPPNPWTRLAPAGFESNATEQGDECTGTTCRVTQGGKEEQSETFIGVPPYDSDRILVQSNNINDGTEGAFLSSDGGKTYKRLKIPNAFDAPGETEPEMGDYCCDPMSAEDNLGNIWFGGLTSGVEDENGEVTDAPSRIVTNRIAAGTEEFQPVSTALPLLPGSDGKQPADAGQQDKNLMTIDNSPTSPTYGRLYVTWNDTGGGNMVILSHCDTRTAGLPTPERCDEADNWSVPIPISARGSVIYADAAVGPDGKVYVTWWDFSSRNAILGRVCDPNTADCDKAESFSEAKDIAVLSDSLTALDEDSQSPLPFACPIPAQPGGRPGPSPGVEVDISDGPNRGRVYVSWGDLRDGSGVRRCEQVIVPGTPPTPDAFTWDSFVASAPNGQLPGDKKPSAEVATRLYTDADVQEEQGQEPEKDDQGNAAVGGNSDEWFPWLVVDQQSGKVYGDFYSTRDTPSTDRRKTHFYTREVIPNGNPDDPGGHGLGILMRSSTMPSDYSAGTTACCVFGNDYGDYTGLDSAEGSVFPVWTRRAGVGDDGDAYTVAPADPNPNLVLQDAKVGEAAGADGDGRIEPGEPIRMFVTVRNPSEVGVTAVNGTLFSLGPKATVTQPKSPYPDIGARGGTGTNTTAFESRLAADIPCGAGGAPTPVDFRVGLETAQGPESVSFLVPVCAAATAPGPQGPGPDTTPTATPTPTPGPIATPTPDKGTTPQPECTPTSGFRSTSAKASGRGLRLDFTRRTGNAPVAVDVFQQSRGRSITGERLVARFTNKGSAFTWNGRATRGGKTVRDGYYFARFRIRTPAGIDTRRVTLVRRNGRFSQRPSFYGRDTCSTLRSYKLSRPVFGGRD